MSTQVKYLGGNPSNSLAKEFEERRRYFDKLKSLEVPVINTLYEKKLYGHLDREFNVIAPPNTPESFGAYASTVPALGYIVDMFEKFRNFYFDVSGGNSSIGVPEIISDLTPTKSFVSLDSEYIFNKARISDLVYGIINERVGNVFISLAEFAEIVNEVLFLSDFEDLRITKSGFSMTDCYFTGLYVDMSKNYQPDIDLIKGQLIEDPNFKCYCAFAQEHGFLVDASSPWRLVVDLEADVTRQTILNGRPMEQFDNFFSDVYTMKVGYDDYWEIEIFYQFLYNEYIKKLNERGIQTPILINYPSEVSLPRSVAETQPSNPNSRLWLKCLVVNKLREFKIIRSYDEFSDFDEIYQNCIDILNNNMVQFSGAKIGILNNPSSPIGFINREFSKIIENLL